MERNSHPSSDRWRWPHRHTLIVLLLLAATMAGLRSYTWDEPVERDIAFYAVVGHEMALGKRLYTDVWDHYPPGVTSTYMLAELLFGYGPLQLYMLWLGAVTATMFAVYTAGSSSHRRGGEPWQAIGVLAASLYAIVAGDMLLQANQPNTEVFINACVAWAFALLVTWPSGDSRLRPEAVGLLLSAAIVYKQVALFTAVGLVLMHVAAPPRDRRRALLEAVRMATTGVVAGVTLIGYFALTGRLRDLWDKVVMFSLQETVGADGGAFAATTLSKLWIPEMNGLLPLAALAALGLAFVRRPSRRVVLLAAWLGCTWLGVSIKGKFFPHYYQLFIPVLAIAAAWSVAAWLRRARRFAVVVASLALVASVGLQVPGYTVPPRDWPLRKYGDYGQLFVDAQRAGRVIGEALDPGETFWQWGYEPQLYFYSGRRPATSVLFLWPIMDGPGAGALAEKVLTQLKEDQPALIVTHPMYALPPGHGIADWIERRYRPSPELTGAEPFLLRGRRDLQRSGRQR